MGAFPKKSALLIKQQLAGVTFISSEITHIKVHFFSIWDFWRCQTRHKTRPDEKDGKCKIFLTVFQFMLYENI